MAAQIAVAEGKELPFSQDDVKQNGWAIECRIYAEDPENNFLLEPNQENLRALLARVVRRDTR